MMTVKESPARRLRRELGLDMLPTRGGAHSNGYNIGDHVARKDDERHTGRVVSVTSHMLHVQWDDTKWHEYNIYPDDVMHVD